MCTSSLNPLSLSAQLPVQCMYICTRTCIINKSCLIHTEAHCITPLTQELQSTEIQ